MLHELKSRIKLLEKQNAQHAGHMEEKLLLWLVTESIHQPDSIPDLIYNLLDRVAVLLDLPFGACYEIRQNKLHMIKQFSQSESMISQNFELSIRQEIFEKLNSGPLIVSNDSSLFPAIDFDNIRENEIKQISFYPFQSISIPLGIFVFISSNTTAITFDNVSNALHYLINIAVEKIEKLSLRDELKELNRVFEARLNERTSSLEEKLKEMKAKLDFQIKNNKGSIDSSEQTGLELNKSLDYLKSVGVEVRSPLNGILGFSELLRDESQTAEERENYIDIIKSCGKSILKIVDDAVELSRIEQEKNLPEMEEIILAEFMTDLYDHYKNDELLQQRKKVELKLNLKINSSAKINSDIRFLSQVLSNLIGNAIKFTNEGTIELGCQVINQSDESETPDIRFFVKDTGVGIQEEVKEKIFDRFYKVEHEIARLYGGLGLGLTIAKILIEKLGGTIGFESYQGKGSDFFFTLPSTAVVPGSIGNIEKIKIEPAYTWEDKQILIVEDDKMSLIFLQEVLKSTGAKLMHVGDGKSAVEMVKNNSDIDLILMDIKLPGISGYEATEIIRRFSNISIIAQTAFAMTDDYKRMLQVGCDDYISKPINRKNLLMKIDSIFKYHNR